MNIEQHMINKLAKIIADKIEKEFEELMGIIPEQIAPMFDEGEDDEHMEASHDLYFAVKEKVFKLIEERVL